MADELQVSSSTDTQNTVAAIASGEDGRATVDESSLSNFEQSADGKVVSYESDQSERQRLLERLSEAEAEVELPVEQAEDGLAVDESGLTVEERKRIREAVIQRVIDEGGPKIYGQLTYSAQEQAQQHLAAPDALNQLREQLAAPFFERMQQLRAQAPDIAELDTNIPIPMAVQDALLALPGGPEATLYLIRHPEQARELQQLPEHVAVAKVAQLTARLTTPPRRAISNAPLPISPVGGSSTRSSLPADEMSYQDFARMRERQIKAKVRR